MSHSPPRPDHFGPNRVDKLLMVSLGSSQPDQRCAIRVPLRLAIVNAQLQTGVIQRAIIVQAQGSEVIRFASKRRARVEVQVGQDPVPGDHNAAPGVVDLILVGQKIEPIVQSGVDGRRFLNVRQQVVHSVGSHVRIKIQDVEQNIDRHAHQDLEQIQRRGVSFLGVDQRSLGLTQVRLGARGLKYRTAAPHLVHEVGLFPVGGSALVCEITVLHGGLEPLQAEVFRRHSDDKRSAKPFVGSRGVNQLALSHVA